MTGAAVAKRDALQQLVATVDRPEYRQQLAEMLPDPSMVDKFARTMKLGIQKNPELLDADRTSLFLAGVQGAASGLLPDGRESAFVVVKVKGKDTVQWWPMIGGLRKKAAEHGITLAASVVYTNDTFTYSTMPPAVEHKPTPLGQERGDPLGAFAAALDETGRVICPPVVMSVDDIEKVRATSRTGSSEYSPWVKWWDRMACKTVARRLFAEMPLRQQEREALVERLADVDEGAVDAATSEVPALAGLPLVDPTEVEEVEGEVVPEDDDIPFGDAHA